MRHPGTTVTAAEELDPHKCKNVPPVINPLIERYRKQRWIIQLNQQVKVVSHFLECGNTDCERCAAVYRPYQEDALALRGYTFGLDVVARIGELRSRDNLSITKIRERLKSGIESRDIPVKEVALLCEVFLALVTTVARQEQRSSSS